MIGKIWTPSARRLVSRLRRSTGLSDQIFCQCSRGMTANTVRSASTVSSICVVRGMMSTVCRRPAGIRGGLGSVQKSVISASPRLMPRNSRRPFALTQWRARGPGDHTATDPDNGVGRVEEQIREPGVIGPELQELLHRLVISRADPRNRRPGEAGVVAQCPDRLVDFPGGDPVDPGLADHRVECLVDPPTWVRQRREERPFSWFRDRQINRPGRRSENCAEQNRRGRPVMGHRGSTFRILGGTTGLPR